LVWAAMIGISFLDILMLVWAAMIGISFLDRLM